ncbi:ImmA/IrrE family metallo-endopeptidase [Aquimarina sp. 2201CG5-10]|uniref:ImmA/IrrE family metallo-endopeptidase n=1 Tax=Aquimarina callyspongiae TaxID=3098150 RepID=UPI002AB44B04|nr:ImmA/IrrE family metallo-endopeptidase [Aquimarina sp. 2201CG5-10]MDY8136919.1 ImmA/IrrE family metallo-endopeptidase [Aquimarina sp. 2201CG5-10]
MYTYKKIEQIANDVLINYSLMKAPVDLNKLAKKLKIIIEPQDLSDDISGFLLKKDNKTIIGLNKNHPEVRKRFTISHEIGHYKLHNVESPLFVDYFYRGSMLRTKESEKIYRSNHKSNNPLMEKQANFFAASILMPRKLIQDEIEKLNDNLTYDDKLYRLSDIFQVSTQAMDYRLKALGYYDYGF